jgi:hypothetical protein
MILVARRRMNGTAARMLRRGPSSTPLTDARRSGRALASYHAGGLMCELEGRAHA